MSGLQITITDAGYAALVNAENSGTDPVLIASADTGRVRWLRRNSWSYERMEAAISSFNAVALPGASFLSRRSV